MKVCIQDQVTNQYFKSPYVWVEDRASACGFATSLEARDFCLRMDHGRKPRVLLMSDDPQQDVCLFSFDARGCLAGVPVASC
jgi:hypothetical protein